jgi:hypothetical protein
VGSIRHVTDMMGDISSASNEQALGVAQIGEAITHMDQATQQNAALVEQIAAAASSLKSQAGDLVNTVSVFKLDATQQQYTTAPRAVAHTPPAAKLPQPARAQQIAPPRAKPRAIAATAPKALPTTAKALAKPSAAPSRAPAPAPAASKANDDEWETF